MTIDGHIFQIQEKVNILLDNFTVVHCLRDIHVAHEYIVVHLNEVFMLICITWLFSELVLPNQIYIRVITIIHMLWYI